MGGVDGDQRILEVAGEDVVGERHRVIGGHRQLDGSRLNVRERFLPNIEGVVIDGERSRATVLAVDVDLETVEVVPGYDVAPRTRAGEDPIWREERSGRGPRK